MCCIEILSILQADKWNYYLSQLPLDQKDVFFTPDYCKLYEENGDGKALCFVCKSSRSIAMFPFLRNKINDLGYDLEDEFYDIQGVYGYNGVATTKCSTRFLNSFFSALLDYFAQNKVVTVFSRINPFILPEKSFEPTFSLMRTNTIYSTNLDSKDVMYDEYEHSTRKNINKAIKNGVYVEIYRSADKKIQMLPAFLHLYYRTMDRNNAQRFYYLSDVFFTNLLLNESINSSLNVAFAGETPISSELVLSMGVNSYSFLGGTNSDYFHLRPNDLLKHEIIQDMKKQGMKRFILGGGSIDGDGISAYKKSFAKRSGRPFFIATKILFPDVYEQIQAQWRERFPRAAALHANKIQGYRFQR